jgi:hypothetical protein
MCDLQIRAQLTVVSCTDAAALVAAWLTSLLLQTVCKLSLQHAMRHSMVRFVSQRDPAAAACAAAQCESDGSANRPQTAVPN